MGRGRRPRSGKTSEADDALDEKRYRETDRRREMAVQRGRRGIKVSDCAGGGVWRGPEQVVCGCLGKRRSRRQERHVQRPRGRSVLEEQWEGGPVWREGADGEAEPCSRAEVSGSARAHSQSRWALTVKAKALASTPGEAGARERATCSDTSSRHFSGCRRANALGEGARKAGRRLLR